jgi:glycosyltransferase involved in cell wall biosynthesis
MNDALPLVTIGIPAYDRPAALKIAIESVLSQTYSNIELIISDNCSTDPEVERVCTTFQMNNKQISYYRQPINIGPIANFEYVLKNAAGKYFNWLADDDWLDADYIERCVKELEQSKDDDLVLVSGTIKYHNEDGEYAHIQPMFDVIEDKPAERIKTYYKNVSDNSLFCGLYKTAVVKEIKIRNLLATDWIFLSEILCLGKAKSLPGVFYNRSLSGVSHNKKALAKMFRMNKLQRLFFWHYVLYIIIKTLRVSKQVNARFNYIGKFFLLLNILVIVYRRYSFEDYYGMLKELKQKITK